ncbi:tail fiber domain-containing protein [bacterium]|nr:tail fiber domain-containing protein [bacterium]
MYKLPKYKKRIVLLTVIFLFLSISSISASIPENLNYQGKLKDNVGTPITGLTTIQFSIYNHLSNGAPSDIPSSTGPLLWTEIYDQGAGNCIQIDPDDSGIFGQRLGTCVSFPAYMDFTDEYYIGVKVGVDGEATPRIPLSSNPYAHRAGGLYADSEDIQVETENSGNVVFNSAGNVQMTSNDVTPALIINQLGTGNLFEVQDNGVTSFVILDGGNVGIGTSTPRTSLELDGAFLATGIYDEGWTEPDLGEGARMMWYPRRAAFRAGYVDGTQWDHGEIGDYSVAMGYSTIASGNYAFAVGEETTASGTAAVAMGSGTQATDTGSIAMGSNTTSSGNGSIAMGSGATSTMDGSIAIGHNTTASHDGATAMGYGTTASGHFATALGQGTIASGDWATAMGSGIEASSTYTIAIGLDNMTGTNCNQANSLCVMGGEVGIGTIAPLTALHIDSNGTNTTAILTLENTAGDFQVFRTDATPESAITGSVGDLAVDGTSGDMYIKNTGTGTNTGWEQLATGSGASTFLALTDTPPAYTAGSLLFTSGSAVTEDNANLFWDDATNRLGIGTSTPGESLEVAGNIYVNAGQVLINPIDAWENPLQVYESVGGDVAVSIQVNGNSENSLNIKDNNVNTVKINGNGDTYFNGGDIAIGTTSVEDRLHIAGGNVNIDKTYGIAFDSTSLGRMFLDDGTNQANNDLLIAADLGGSNAIHFVSTDDLSSSYLSVLPSEIVALAGGVMRVSANSGSIGGSIRLNEGNTGGLNYVGFIAPATVASNVVWTLPNADGTNGQVLETDGSGALSWVADSGATTFLALTDTPAAYTAGSVLFTSGSEVTEDNTNFFWDDTNKRLGIGTVTPDENVHIVGAQGETATLTIWADQGDDSADQWRMIADGASLSFIDLYGRKSLYLGYHSEVVINQDGNDFTSFRVESDTDEHAFFVNATNGRVGIGATAPIHKFQVSGDHDEGRILIHDSDGNNDDEVGLLFAVSGDLSVSPAKGGIFFNRTDTYGRGDLIFATDNNADSTEVAKDDIRMSIKSRGEVIVGDAIPTHISGSGSLYVDQYIEIGKSLYVGSQIVRRADLDTYIDFEDEDSLEIRAGGVRMLSLIEGVSDSVVINEYSSDVDFRVEGDTEANLFFVDAGTDNVGINTNTPRTALEISGDGAILATGTFGSGWTEPDLGAGTRMVWYPQKSAFRVGRVTGTHWNETNIGNYSVAMGYDTAASGDYSTAIGGRTTASEDYTFATGYNTSTLGRYSSTFGSGSRASGRYSMAIGYSSDVAGNYAFTGGSNMQPTSGDGTFVWGYSASAQAFAPSNNRFLIFPQGDDGMVGVGTVSPASILELEASAPILTIDSAADNDAEINLSENGTVQWNIYNDGDNSDRLYITDNDNDNGVYIAQDATSWTANSDIRLKENVITIDNALESVLNMRGVRYNFIGTDNTEIGVIAQEVEGYFPEIVDTDGEYWGVSYSRIAPILIEAIKELHIKIDSLGDLGDNEEFVSLLNDLVDRVDGVETRLDDNDTEVDLLKSENEALKSDNVLMKEDLCVLGIERWCEE